MRPQVGFSLSLLAACGIHAILLFAPHAALVADVRSPTVELELAVAAGTQDAAARSASPPAAAVPRPATAPAPAAPAPAPQAAIPPLVETAQTAPASTAAPATPAAATNGQADVASPEAPAAASDASTGEGSGSAASGRGGSLSSAGGAPGSTPGTGGHPSVAVPVFVPPRPLADIVPKYPLNARRAGFEGVVKVIVDVDERGEVTAVRILTSSGHSSLDQAVLDAYRAARYAPAFQHGKPVAGTDVWSYRFRLKD